MTDWIEVTDDLTNKKPGTWIHPDDAKPAIVGRTIVDFVRETTTCDPGDNAVTLTLDDGTRLSFRAWGHDDWGVTTELATA